MDPGADLLSRHLQRETIKRYVSLEYAGLETLSERNGAMLVPRCNVGAMEGLSRQPHLLSVMPRRFATASSHLHSYSMSAFPGHSQPHHQ